MATSFTQVYQYARPENVDISVLGKAQMYKQQMYDQNVSATQQLINQYAGSDLMRGVDQEYLGERLNTLVNYINQSGTMDWSRRSVATDVAQYIGQALDQNVMAGIASTQRYRKQMAEIEDIKKNKPDQYSSQNEWLATRDLQRYMTSNQVGDSYKAGSYIPYTDVNKLIKDGLPILKDYGVDVKWTDDGNPLLVRLDKHEVLSENEAGKYLNMILGEKGNQQLHIDGMYKYRGASDDDIRNTYTQNLNNQIQEANNQANTLKVMQSGKTEAEKQILNQKSQQFTDYANSLTSRLSEVSKTDRDTLAGLMHSNEIKTGWSKLLAFDRVTDIQYDDRNYKIAVRNDDIEHKKWEKQQREAEFMATQTWKEKDYELEKIKALSKGEISIDANGNVTTGTGKAIGDDGITATSNPTPIEESKQVLAEDVYNNYSQAFIDAKAATTAYIQELQSTEQGRKILQQHYGNIATGDAVKLAYAMMRGDKESQARLSNLRDVMNKSQTGQNALSAIEKSIGAYRQTKQMDTYLDAAQKGMGEIVSKVMQADNIDKEFYGLSGKIVGSNGKLQDGSYIGKNYNSLTSQEKLGAIIGGISNRLFAGKVPDSERSALTVLRKKLIAQLQDKEAQKHYNDFHNEDKSSFLDYVGSTFSGIGQGIRAGYNRFMHSLTGDDEDKRAYEDAEAKARQDSGVVRGYERRVGQHINDMFNIDYTFNDLASNDLKSKGKTLSLGKDKSGVYNLSGDEIYTKNVGANLQILHQQLQDSQLYDLGNKSINIDSENKNTKELVSWAKAYFGSEIQNNANIRVDINKETNEVSITAPVKEGKEYVLQTSEPIPMDDVPENLISRLITSVDKTYDARNPNALSLVARGQIYNDKSKITELYGDLEIDPMATRSTKEDVVERVEIGIGNENYQKYKAEIDAIINSPVELEARPVQGVYVMDIKSGNTVIGRQVLGTNIAEQKDLITSQRDKIATEKIIEFITKKYSK